MKKFLLAVMMGIFSNCFESQSAIVQNSLRKSVDEKLDSLLKFCDFKITDQDSIDVIAHKCHYLQEKVNSDAVSVLSSLIKELPAENLTPEQKVRSIDLQNLMYRTTELASLFEKHAVEMQILSTGNSVDFRMLDAFSPTVIRRSSSGGSVIYELATPVRKSKESCISEAKKDYQKFFNFVIQLLNFCNSAQKAAARFTLMRADPESWQQYSQQQIPEPQPLGYNVHYRDLERRS